MLSITSYLTQCVELARSVQIYSTTLAKQTQEYYTQNDMQDSTCCEDMENHPYHLHLRGLSTTTDTELTFMSLDTSSIVLLTELDNHPKTKQRLLTDVTYRNKFTDDLGIMGHQRLMGRLYPYTGTLPVRDGTILYYDSSLVEPHEYSLMADLQEWIYRSLYRWTNSKYVLSDALYAAALLGILYVHMPSQIVTLRDRRQFTQQAHTFHVQAYLSDYGFTDHLSVIPEQQQYDLYKNVQFLVERAGHNKSYQYYTQLLTNTGKLQISEYSTYPVVGDTDVGIRKGQDTISIEQLTDVTSDTYSQVQQALSEGQVLDNLPFIDVTINGTDRLFPSLRKTMIDTWGWLATTNKYVDSLTIALPNGTLRTLTTTQAFIYYALHRPSKLYSPTQQVNTYVFPRMQVVSGYTGEDLIDFTALHAITRKLFPSTIEKMYNDQTKLRAAIDVTPISERAYWEGEFLRSYAPYMYLLPDKTTWLTTNDLPIITDETFLDKLADLYTGYSETVYASTLGTESKYINLLNSVLSMSTHIAPATDTYQNGSFIQQPMLMALPVL